MQKTFKTLEEQIEIMKDKGLTINNTDYAREVLLRENYFFLNGYRHLLMDSTNKRFIESSTFEELYSIFIFDRKFRNIIFKNLLIIENNLKSIISYQLSKKYGYREADYLKPKNFNTAPEKIAQVNDVIRKMKRQVRVNGKEHAATMHYMSNYGYIPLWIMVKVLSFGIVGELYSILKNEDQDAIASVYDVDVENLKDYLPILSNYRNLCAHEEIMFEHKTQKQIRNNFYHKMLKIEKDNEGEYIYGKNDVFALIIMMKELLTDDNFYSLMVEIEGVINNLDYNLKSISIDKVLEKMGFPKNYRDLKNITRKVEIL